MLSQIISFNTTPLYAYGHAIIDEELWQYFGKKCCKGCVGIVYSDLKNKLKKLFYEVKRASI